MRLEELTGYMLSLRMTTPEWKNCCGRIRKLNNSYVSRMVNLTTLVPDLVAAILDEMLPPEGKLFELAAGTPLVWGEQWGRLGRLCPEAA